LEVITNLHDSNSSPFSKKVKHPPSAVAGITGRPAGGFFRFQQPIPAIAVSTSVVRPLAPQRICCIYVNLPAAFSLVLVNGFSNKGVPLCCQPPEAVEIITTGRAGGLHRPP